TISRGRVNGAGAGAVAGMSTATGRGLILNIGAGCGPGCRQSALIRTIAIALAATASARTSRGLRPNRRINATRSSDWSSSRSSATAEERAERSGTLLHLDVGG